MSGPAIVRCVRVRWTASVWIRPVMKSLRIIVRRRGSPEVLETAEGEAPAPGRDEVRVRVFAAGVSFAE